MPPHISSMPLRPSRPRIHCQNVSHISLILNVRHADELWNAILTDAALRCPRAHVSTWRKDSIIATISWTLGYTLERHKEPRQRVKKKRKCHAQVQHEQKKIVIVQPAMPPLCIQLASRPFRTPTDIHSGRKKETPRHFTWQELRNLLFSPAVANVRPWTPYHPCSTSNKIILPLDYWLRLSRKVQKKPGNDVYSTTIASAMDPCG